VVEWNMHASSGISEWVYAGKYPKVPTLNIAIV
jgi:hypothetical protein